MKPRLDSKIDCNLGAQLDNDVYSLNINKIILYSILDIESRQTSY